MKKFLKFLFIFILLILAAAGAYYLYQQFTQTERKSAFEVVPENTVFAVQTKNLSRAWGQLQQNKIWKHLQETPRFGAIHNTAREIDKWLKQNEIVASLFSGRELLLTAHMTSGVGYNFLFVIDLAEATRLKALKEAINLVEGMQVKTRDFAGNEILEVINKQTGNTLQISLIDNLAVASFSGALIEQSLVVQDKQYWKKNADFQKVKTRLSQRNLFNFYFNFSLLEPFYRIYVEKKDPLVQLIARSLNYSAFELELDSERIGLGGFTGVDSVATYLTEVARTKPGKLHAQEVIPDQAAVYFSLCFDHYEDFHERMLMRVKKTDEDYYKSYRENLEKIERFLNIKAQRDFFDWIGEEIAIAKLRPSSKDRAEDLLIAIHSRDIAMAKDRLGYITGQIRKKSPLKFEGETYRNFQIHMLQRKNLFKLFFTDLFNRMEKPYFTFIDDFVMLSNSTEVLKTAIDEYRIGNTLKRSDAFSAFKDRFQVNCNISLYLQMPELYPALVKYSQSDLQQQVQDNQSLIMSFARLGLQITGENGIAESQFMVEYDSLAYIKDRMSQIEKQASAEAFRSKLENAEFAPEIPDSVEEGRYTIYYPDSSIHMEGMVKDGKPGGLWRIFYPNGNIRATVNYKAGEAQGEALFYFNDTASTKRAVVQFKDHEMVDVYREFYPNGARRAEIEYDEGDKHGEALFYHQTGALKIEGYYKNDKKHRRWKYYDKNGELIEKERWRRGEKK